MKKIQEAPIPDFDENGDFKQWKDLPGEDLSTYHHRALKKMMAKSEPVLKAKLQSELKKFADLGISSKVLNGINGKITLNSDRSISVDGSVTLIDMKLSSMPLRFGHVTGDFICAFNQLTSLAGAPHTVGGRFSCESNKLVSLEGAPHTVGGRFSCESNQLTSLAGAPREVGSDFICARNQLSSLEGLGQVKGEIRAKWNPVPEAQLIADWHAAQAGDAITMESYQLVERLIG